MFGVFMKLGSRFIVGLGMLSFGWVVMPQMAYAQEELTEAFIAEDESFRFDHPEGWEVETDSETGIVILSGEDVTVTFYGPSIVAEAISESALENVEDALAEFLEAEEAEVIGDIEAVELGERQAAQAQVESDDENTTTTAFSVEIGSEGAVGVVVFVVPADQAEDFELTMQAIAESFNVPSGLFSALASASTSEVNCTVSTDAERYASVRVGPGENRTAIAFLTPDTEFKVLGQAEADDGSKWWKLDKAEVAPNKSANEVWVAQNQVTEIGECDKVVDAAAPPIIPIVVAPTGGEPASNESAILPDAGTYTVTFGSSVTVTCGGVTQSVAMGLPQQASIVTVLQDGAAITLDGDRLDRVQTSIYSGQFEVPVEGQIYIAVMTIQVIAPDRMQGTITMDVEGCNAVASLTLTR